MGLTASDISFSYGAGTAFGVEALRGVSLTVDRGEVVVVAGTTGSGKSTLLRVLAGLLVPSAGSVRVDNVPLADAAARGRVAIVFQNPESQFFAETVTADVEFGPRNLGMPDPQLQAANALETVGLDPAQFSDRSPFGLSGGEARRVAIAGALAMRADYLLLDEPTAGLDASGTADVLMAITAERSRAGIVVVTHDPDDFLAFADRVVALAAGACAFSGSVADVLEHPDEYEAAGLRLPEVAALQHAARDRGLSVPRISLDPAEAAAALRADGGVRA